MSATPFFIVSSGRSGTAMLHKALSALPNVEMHHEYMVHHIQPLAVRRYWGSATSEETRTLLNDTYGAAVHYCERSYWGDSSNKVSWLIPELAALFPSAKFVHLVRDGRKVAGSYFHKLGEECYDPASAEILRAHLENGAPMPPPEKKYWWPRPKPNDPMHKAFDRFCQFERMAWHWSEINHVILNDLAPVSENRKHFVRLEDLRDDQALLRALYNFLELPYSDEAFALFQRPHNVNRPEDKLLTDAQREQFEAIAGPMMTRLGYAGRAEYVVNY
jgi:hypothetical protein